MDLSISKKLQSLNEVTKKLIQCKSLSEVVSCSLAEIRNRLEVQVASIFLIDKEGRVQRVGIDGHDKFNNPIENDWLDGENYLPGESFSGYSMPTFESNLNYGKPNYVNEFSKNNSHMKYGNEYIEKLGLLQSGISVPLNGLYKSFGTIEVLNKKNNQQFTESDLYWLMLIGSNVADTISSFINNKYNQNFKLLIENLVDLLPTNKDFNLKMTYEDIARKVIKEFTPYKVCIIRIPDKNESLNIESQVCTEDISFVNRKDSSIPRKSYIIGEVYNSHKAEYINDIDIESDKFFNYKWIKSQGLKSFACLPLIVKNTCVGTLSVYTGFKTKFYNSDKDILNYIAFLVAAITERFRIVSELRKVRNELSDAQEKFLNASILVGYEAQLKNIVHQYKNELIEESLFLQEIQSSKKSQKEKKYSINEKLNWLEMRIKEIEDLVSVENPIPIQINNLINNVLMTISSESIIIQKKLGANIPIIYANPEKFSSIIHNLISNAIIAINASTTKNGLITIYTSTIVSKDIPKIQVIVEDNGIGISNNIRDKIYDQGFTTRRDRGGTGLGLYISKTILDEYGGKIRFNSKFGKGTKFYIEIPILRNQM
ncbi:GAF domain-containing sensor histidine kinase [Acaryochloris marina NIES-2412]|uniref:GAF domain-containing sensor histidine kinase n=1 Tax=Acaryochloris marina TaxID=155978 RepID=UPI004059EC63